MANISGKFAKCLAIDAESKPVVRLQLTSFLFISKIQHRSTKLGK